MSMKTMNPLIVSIFARAAMDRRETGTSDLGMAASKIRNNIRQGRAVDPVAGIPAAYVPDFAALRQKEMAMGEDAFAKAWAEINNRRQKHYGDLCKLWKVKDYDGMIALMDDAETVHE